MTCATTTGGLYRTIKVLCVLLAVLTFLLLYVLENAIITKTTVIKQSLRVGDEIVGSSLETQFRSLKMSQCPRFANSETSSWPASADGLWRPLPKTGMLLHSAFLDERTELGDVKYRFVRILGLKRGRGLDKWPLQCHFMSANNGTATSVEADYHEIWVSAWHAQPPEDFFHSIMIHCAVPRDFTTTIRHIAISQHPCDAKNAMLLDIRSSEIHKSKKDFCVCVKPLDFGDIPGLAERLIEWIEINIALGAQKIVFYIYSVPGDVEKVLAYYREQLVITIEVIPWELPGHLPNDPETRSQFLKSQTWQRRRLEVLPYNHCFYSNMNQFHFVVPLDIDEVIFPLHHPDWKTLLNRVLFKQHALLDTVASFAVQNTYFFHDWTLESFEKNNAEGDHHQQQKDWKIRSFFESTFRTGNFSPAGHSVKSFINTRIARSVFNHYALGVLRAGQKFLLNLKPNLVQLNHFKENCQSSLHSKAECENVFLPSRVPDDTFSLRFGPKVMDRKAKVLQALGMHHQSPFQD